jgi:glutamyl-tRNA synthetase
MTVRTRFAPSPTGYLHIGGVRTALFNWLFARQHGGQFILRIDDTDQQRNVEAALPPILDGFRWLGLDWDEGPEVGGPRGPYYQSQRLVRYQEVVQQLLDRGAAYRDFARPDEIQAEREEAERAGRTFVYSRRWMAETEEAAEAFRAAGRTAVVRLKMPREGVCRLTDLVRGDVEFAWENEQDHVIQRADGSCLYHLASVADDHDFQISHVIRAIEHLSNTPRQIFIAQALDMPLPAYAHLPYVAEPGSQSKLSKRKIAKYLKQAEFEKIFGLGKGIAERLGMEVRPESFNPVLVDFYKTAGFLPDALVNYLLMLGWSLDDKTEDFSREEMIRVFDLSRVNKSPASLDVAKLLSFQERYMQQVPLKQKVALVLPFLQRVGWVATPPPCEIGPYLQRILEACGDRIKVAGDILQYEELFCSDDALSYDEKAFQKRFRDDPEAPARLERFRHVLAEQTSFDAPVVEQGLREFLEREQLKMGQMVHLIRLAVTGKTVGFGLFETMEIVGQEKCLTRIDRALQRVGDRA